MNARELSALRIRIPRRLSRPRGWRGRHMSGGYCTGCGRADMAWITHICPPLDSAPAHRCSPPILVGLTTPGQPDWTCGSCGRVWRDMRSGPLAWWAEIQGPREGVA